MTNKLHFNLGYRMQYEEVQECFVILYPEGMVQLSDSAAAILKYCDGTKNSDEIIKALKEEFPGADLEDDVLEFITDAKQKCWIKDE